MSNKLTDRLRGRYEIGLGAEFGVRQFSDIPPISIEAANRIEELEHALYLALTAAETESKNPVELVINICHEALGGH